MLPRSFPCPFIKASRFLTTASLSCASATPPSPATANVNTAASTACRVDDFISPPSRVNLGSYRWLPQNNVRPHQSNSPEPPSPLRDRYFDVGLEAGTLAHPLVPGFEVPQRRSLDRERMPAVYHGSQH